MDTTVDQSSQFLLAILNGKQQPNRVIVDDTVTDDKSSITLSRQKINALQLLRGIDDCTNFFSCRYTLKKIGFFWNSPKRFRRCLKASKCIEKPKKTIIKIYET